MPYERFPKLESPFIRRENTNGQYTVTREINNDYDWVFDNPDVIAVEKLDGENIAVEIDDGRITNIYTREGNIVNPFEKESFAYIIEGVSHAFRRGWIRNLSDGLHYGELVGPQSKGVYDLGSNLWVPFSYAQENLMYESWGDYPKTYTAINEWLKELLPLFYARMNNYKFSELPLDAYVEGIIFTHPDGRMAKLRRDMFDWYYEE